MAGIARSMLRDALAAFVARNPPSARAVCLRDDRVDNLHRSLYRILLTHMMEDPAGSRLRWSCYSSRTISNGSPIS